MAAILFFLLVSALSSVSAQQVQSTITSNSSLSPTTNSSWLSLSGLFAFGFYPQGNGSIVGIWFARFPQKPLVWTANRDDPPVSSDVSLLFTSEGRLVLRPREGEDVTVIDAPQSASSASMLDSGNFVLYDSNQEIIWQSFDYPTDTLLQGQRLNNGKELFSSLSETDSSTGIFRLKMQDDGNLVQYPVRTPDTAPYSYWSSDTNGQGKNVMLNLDDDGRLYLLNTSTGFIIKNITTDELSRPTNGTKYHLKIDADGIFRLYSHGSDRNGNWSNRSIIYSSSTDRCDPKGLCGLNSFCTLMDQDPDCKCIPGFDFIDQSQQRLGCVRNFSEWGCPNKSDKGRYTISMVENTIWENDPYFVLSSTTKDDCKEECLKDCSCDAALFKDGECRKQKLPLRYGRRDQGESTMALVKVSSETPKSSNDDDSPTREKPAEKKKALRLDILIISISFATLALIMLAISGVIVHRHRVWAYKKIIEQQNIGLAEDVVLRSFTYKELEEATNGFRDELGRGSFGIVFKGTLFNNQRLVAIKRLENVVAQGEREFRTEMKVIGRTQHKNLVRLLGYCHDGPNRLLVYEYMSNGTLADMLFNPETHPCWNKRVGIALDVARGILYLHEECETQIIHCDIKPQNILMDDNRCAKISDFGLAKMLKPEETRTFTGIRGTRGYVAPEWHRRTSITVKADVYSFGILLLEIICCRRNMDMNCAEDEVILVDSVYTCLQAGELQKLVDDEEVDKRKLERMVRVGIWCIQDEPSLRPSMKKVVLMLEGTVDIPVPPSPSSFLSSV